MKSTKNISLPAFGASKGDYDWPGGAKGGLNSLIKNKLSGELYLISSSPNFNENLKQEDFFISAVFPCKEKRGLVLRDIEVFWNYSSLECYRNTLHEIQDVHEHLKRVVSTIDRKEWGAEIPDPIPPDGLSPDAYALMTAKGFSQDSIRARFGFCRESVFEQTIQDEPSQEIQIFAENLDLLELEFKALQHELADLKSLKVEIEKELKDFASRYDLELGEIILKLLDLRAQFSESKNDNPDTEKEARRAKNDYEEYKSKLESAEVNEKLDLSPTEQAELKKSFRMASKLCHPDIVAHDEKERANQIFINLKNAYEKNNLLKVNEILRNLQINGLDMNFERGASGRAALEQQLHDLKTEISKIREEINKIRKTESYRIFYSTKDINSYFKVKRVEIEKEISILQSHNGTSG
jgi:hypothetical protein